MGQHCPPTVCQSTDQEVSETGSSTQNKRLIVQLLYRWSSCLFETKPMRDVTLSAALFDSLLPGRGHFGNSYTTVIQHIISCQSEIIIVVVIFYVLQARGFDFNHVPPADSTRTGAEIQFHPRAASCELACL